MAASVDVAGQRVDLGSHRLHPAAEPAMLSLLSELLGDDLQVRERNGRIRLRDRWIAFPLRTLDMARNLPPGFTARAAIDTIARPLRRGSTARTGTFLAEVTARLGPTVATEFYGPYARKLYGTEPDRLDAELARRRVSASSPAAVVRRMLRASRTAGRTFLYPRRGYGQICEALADAAVDAGAEIRLETRVDTLRTGDGGTVRVVADGDETAVTTVASTMPLPALVSALDPAPPAEVVAAVGALRTRAMLIVHLVVERDRYTPFDAHYLPGPDTRVARLSEPKNYRDGDDPAGLTVLCAEIPCWFGDELWNGDDDDLGELVAADLTTVGLPPAHHVAAEVRRLRSVYPVYETTTADARRTVEGWVASLSDVVTLGRQGLGVPDNLHHAAAMGISLVGALDDSATVDGRLWRRALEGFTSHVVED